MTTRKEIEDTRHDTEGLAMMASKLGYRSTFRQLVMKNGATASDLFDFFDDNPGACEAVIDFVLEHGQDRDGNDLEEEEDEDDTDEDFEEAGILTSNALTEAHADDSEEP